MLEFSILTIGTFVTMLDSITLFTAEQWFKKDIRKVIPIFSLAYGLILGVAGFYIPTVDMGANIVEAITIGLSAGAAATGVNQVGKQLKKDSNLSAAIHYFKQFVDSIQVLPECVDGIDETPESDVPNSNDPDDDDDDSTLSGGSRGGSAYMA